MPLKEKNMSEETHQVQEQINDHKLIDIERVIASKSKRLARLMPRFLLKYLKRIIHEDVINKHLYDHRNYYGLDFTNASLKHFGVSLIVHGLDNIDVNDKLLIASNHPLGGLDGLSLITAVGLKKKDIIFPVNDLLMNLPNMRHLFVPVNKHGGHPKDAVKLLDEMMSSEKTILFFPAGLVSRRRKGIIRDLEWKKTFVTKAKKHQRKIVPVYIDGQNSNFFYNLANLRKFFRIKTNIEMLYLVDEMYKQYNKELNIYFGKPLGWDEIPAGMSDAQIAEYIKSLVYTLPFSAEFSEDNKLVVEYKYTEASNGANN